MSDFKLRIHSFTEEEEKYFRSIKVLVSNEKDYITVNQGSFQNCQNLTIGYFQGLVDRTAPEKLTERLLELKALHSDFSKPIAIVDIKDQVFEKIKDHIPILFHMKYESTNRSDMVIVLVDFRLSTLQNFKNKR